VSKLGNAGLVVEARKKIKCRDC